MIGRLTRGRQLCAGKFLFAGSVVEAPDRIIWDINVPSGAFDRELHGFPWLDDLAAVGGSDAWDLARIWTQEWIRRFGTGTGPGWSPALTGQRLIRWITHSVYLLQVEDERQSEAFRRSLGHHVEFLSSRWKRIPQGHHRLEALTALVHASFVLTGKPVDVESVITGLVRELDREVDTSGGIPTRNPEELLEILSLLVWTQSVFVYAARIPPASISEATGRIAQTLRTLRHSDGALARFHGGGRGVEGRLDNALVNSGRRRLERLGSAMGFTRLAAGRTTVIMDTAPPPTGTHVTGHASTLAFEMTLGRRPLVINCGSGTQFGEGWANAGRTTALHSALELDGSSSSVLGQGHRKVKGKALLAGVPKEVRVRNFSNMGGKGVQASHDGYLPTHGLLHVRSVELSSEGGRLSGDDTLTVASDNETRRFEKMKIRSGRPGIPFSIRFHLHPDVIVRTDHRDSAVSLRLESGEIWTFQFQGPATLLLQPSVYLEKGWLVPRETSQIVLSGRAMAYVTHVRWTMERAKESPTHIRDLLRENIEVPD